jgi:hypothetical protein
MFFMLKMPRTDCYPMRRECLATSLGIGAKGGGIVISPEDFTVLFEMNL